MRREQRKLDHRRRVAEHLREISERNGNPQLLQVADDMERRAFSHYDQKLQQLGNQHPVDGNPVNDPAVLPQPRGTGQAHSALQPDSLRDEFVGERGEAAADRLTGRDNALYRQLQNEQRQLDRRLEAARRMREVAADTADPRLLDAANQMEDLALTRFDERMSRILDFQERHSLPDVSPDP